MNPGWIDQADLCFASEKGGQTDVVNGSLDNHKVRAEFLFGDPRFQRESASPCCPECAREVIPLDLETSIRGQLVSHPGPIVQASCFGALGSVVDGVKRDGGV